MTILVARLSLNPGASRAAQLTLEVSGQSQGQGDTLQVQFIICGLPCCDQHNRLGGIAPRCMNNAVDVLTLVSDARGGVLVLLRRNFQACGLQYRLYLVMDPGQVSAS